VYRVACLKVLNISALFFFVLISVSLTISDRFSFCNFSTIHGCILTNISSYCLMLLIVWCHQVSGELAGIPGELCTACQAIAES